MFSVFLQVFDARYSNQGREDTLALDKTGRGQENLSDFGRAAGERGQISYKGSVLTIVRCIRGHRQSAVSYAVRSRWRPHGPKSCPTRCALRRSQGQSLLRA